MDTARTLQQSSRPEIRQRRAKRKSSPDTEYAGKEKGQPQRPSDRTSIAQKEEDNHITMTKDHRFFHRRQATTPTKVLTVAVEVIATVDSSGNLVGQETKTQSDPAVATSGADAVASPSNVVDAVASAAVPVAAPVAAPVASAVGNAVNALTDAVAEVPPSVPVPAVPSLPQVPAVPAVPTVGVPTVPAVPPFPTDLTVPAYPWPSGVSAAALQVSAAPASSSPSPTSVLGSAISASSLAALPPISNSTLSSVSSTASLSARGSASLSASASESASVAISSHSGSLTSTGTHSSQRGSATSSPVGGTGILGGGGGPANTADPALNTAAAGSGSSGPTTPLQTPQVVGSVVGSLAGAALILAIILFLLRRHKRQRRGALQLTGDETTDRVPPMSQDPSRNNRIPSTFLNRVSAMSKSTVDTNTSAGERSFQRVSGRKLPSAFSEGMTSDQFSRGGTLSGSSFYTDDQGTYGGPGVSKEFGKEYGKEVGGSAAAGAMSFRPGPARTPIIRHPDDEYSNPFADPAPFPRDTSHLSPPQSPNPDIPRNTLGRSLHSHDGSRSSKFTENV